MNIRDLLVYMDDGIESRKQLEAGLWLAESQKAHLSVLYAPSFSMGGMYYSGGLTPGMENMQAIETQLSAMRQQAEQAKALFEEVTKNASVSMDYQSCDGDPAQLINMHSRYVDLVIIGQSERHNLMSTQASVTDGVILESGCPVLILPRHDEPLVIGERILIAWNESRESARALHDSLPFLTTAAQVDVLMVMPEQDIEDKRHLTVRLQTHLERCGVNANIVQLPGGSSEPAEIILAEANKRGADLVVMGAYGHSRLREMVMGGATRYMLENLKTPLLMSH